MWFVCAAAVRSCFPVATWKTSTTKNDQNSLLSQLKKLKYDCTRVTKALLTIVHGTLTTLIAHVCFVGTWCSTTIAVKTSHYETSDETYTKSDYLLSKLKWCITCHGYFLLSAFFYCAVQVKMKSFSCWESFANVTYKTIFFFGLVAENAHCKWKRESLHFYTFRYIQKWC